MKKKQKAKYYMLISDRSTETSFTVRAGMVVGIVLLCALFLVFSVGKSMAVANTTLFTGPGSLNHPKGWCGQQGQPMCHIDPGWLSVTSEQPDEIARVMMSSPEYAMLQKRASYTALDTPTRVHPLNAHTGITYYDLDHWVASAHNTMGIRVGLFDFIYDAVHRRLRFSSFGVIPPVDAHSQTAFPYIVANQALAKLQSQPGVHILAERQPELVFFLIDPRYNDLSSKKYRWYGGGDSPLNPLWDVTGTGTNDYFVGPDLHTYTRSFVKPILASYHASPSLKAMKRQKG